MITLRFPDGRILTYNTGLHVKTINGYWQITDSQDYLVALVEAAPGLVVEWTAPCSVVKADGAGAGDDIRGIVHDEIRRHEDRERKRLRGKNRRKS